MKEVCNREFETVSCSAVLVFVIPHVVEFEMRVIWQVYVAIGDDFDIVSSISYGQREGDERSLFKKLAKTVAPGNMFASSWLVGSVSPPKRPGERPSVL